MSVIFMRLLYCALLTIFSCRCCFVWQICGKWAYFVDELYLKKNDKNVQVTSDIDYIRLAVLYLWEDFIIKLFHMIIAQIIYSSK